MGLPTLAYFSPLPPARSGIADYSQELLPFLAEYADLTLFVEDPAGVAPHLTHQFNIQPQAHYQPHFDATLYQMGNSDFHEGMYRLMNRYPGFVVLHDSVLHHFIAHRTAGRDNTPAYSREMGYALGPAGVRTAWFASHNYQPYPLTIPLNNRIIDLSLGLIVHSRYLQQQIEAYRSDRPVQHIPALITPQASHSRRASLPWPADSLIFASVGAITDVKRLDLALQAFASLHQTLPNSRYLIVGDLPTDSPLPTLIANLNLSSVVHLVGYAPTLHDFIDWVATADVILNLRYPTLGETSAAALRALAAARPVIVFDVGWYSELPHRVALKVPAMDEPALLTAMNQLAQNQFQRQAMGQAGLEYVKREHAPGRVAHQYAQTLAHFTTTIKQRFP